MENRREVLDALAPALTETVIGGRVKAYRERQGLSQEELAALVYPAMARSTVAKLELGQRPLRVNELVAVAAALNVSPADLWPEVKTKDPRGAAEQTALLALTQASAAVGQQETAVRNLRDRLAATEAALSAATEELTAAMRHREQLSDTWTKLRAERVE